MVTADPGITSQASEETKKPLRDMYNRYWGVQQSLPSVCLNYVNLMKTDPFSRSDRIALVSIIVGVVSVIVSLVAYLINPAKFSGFSHSVFSSAVTLAFHAVGFSMPVWGYVVICGVLWLLYRNRNVIRSFRQPASPKVEFFRFYDADWPMLDGHVVGDPHCPKCQYRPIMGHRSSHGGAIDEWLCTICGHHIRWESYQSGNIHSYIVRHYEAFKRSQSTQGAQIKPVNELQVK